MDLAHHTALPRGLIQVAGVHDLAEARLLVEAGVDLVGIPLRLPVNAEDLTGAEASALSRNLPGRCCLITYLDRAWDICGLAGELGVTWIQLHGDIDPAELAEVRRRLPETGIIKSLVVGKSTPDALLADVERLAPHVDAFITDTFNAATGAEGATGLTHDWRVSRLLRERSPRPLILAGGLRPGNVAEAIRAVRPHGVDVHTGVEGADGRKSSVLVRAFVEAARRAFASC